MGFLVAEEPVAQVYEQKIVDLEKKWEEALVVQANEEKVVIDTLEGTS